MTTKTRTQRLVGELLKGKDFPAYPVMPLSEVADLLLRQDELLRQSAVVLEQANSVMARCMGNRVSDDGDRHRALAASRGAIDSILIHRSAK